MPEGDTKTPAGSGFSQNTTTIAAVYYARLMVDGNTELRVGHVAREHMSTRLRGLLSCIDDEAAGGSEETPRVILPARPWAEDAGPREALAVSRAWRTGRRGARTYHVEVPGAFHLVFSERHCTCSVQLAASMLWAVGYAAAASWVVRSLHSELFWGANDGEWNGRLHLLDHGDPLGSAARAGWSVRRVEVCTDLAEYDRSLDAVHLGFKGKPTYFGVDPEERTYETLALGGGTSAVRMRIYDKRAECLAGGEDTSWKYSGVWRRNGMEPGAPVTRVELVLQDAGLVIEGKTGEEAVDLTDPAALADVESLSAAWRFHATRKRRIVAEDSTRRERCGMHPEWETVINAAEGAVDFEPLSHRQRRAAQAQACDTMAERDRAVAVNAALRFAARELGVRTTTIHAEDDSGHQFNADGEVIVDDERTAEATRLAVQLGFEAMLSTADTKTMRKKADYIAAYYALKETELGEEMRDRASRYIAPADSVKVWPKRRTHKEAPDSEEPGAEA